MMYVYVAEGDIGSKVGITKNPARRAAAIVRYDHTLQLRRFVKTWPHEKARQVENTTKRLLHPLEPVFGVEMFAVPASVMIAKVEKAIALVDAGKASPSRDEISRFCSEVRKRVYKEISSAVLEEFGIHLTERELRLHLNELQP